MPDHGGSRPHPARMVILGIDPGLNVTGYGAIDVAPNHIRLVGAGDIRPPRGRSLGERLLVLHERLAQVIEAWVPDTLVLEMVFVHEQHTGTAALMAHARGVVCLAAEQHRVPMVEYSPARVKQAVTGHGAAPKAQMALMVGRWIGGQDPSWSLDATDALALAIAHAHMQGGRAIPHPPVRRRRRMPAALSSQLR